MSKWTNFNDAEKQVSYELIPHKTITKVRLLIKKGNHITEEFTDGWATLSKAKTSIYLACEFVVLSEEYEHRKVWGNIGLHSDNSPKFADIGRSMIKAILDSAHGLHPADKSPEAEKMRTINSFADLHGLACVAEITINDKGEQARNEIKTFITPASLIYNEFMEERSGKFAIDYGVAKKQTNDDFASDELPF
jgi:hypothetical protein